MKNKKMLMVSTFLLIVFVVVVLIWNTSSVKTLPISLEIGNQDAKDRILGWENENTIYFFLPSYADLSEVFIKLESSGIVNLENIAVENGMSCAALLTDHPYQLTYSAWGKAYQKNMVLLQSDGIATAYLDTQSGDMRYLHENKENSEPGAIRIITDLGDLIYTGEISAISCRGNASWTETEKKSYGITLTIPADLLNLGTANRWILLANALDGTHMRNRLAYDAADAIGLAYTADSQWIDLYLNGEYAGLYLLSERNEVHPERVNISSENSFLVSAEMESRLVNQRIPYVSTNAGQALRTYYPTDMGNALAAELASRLQSVENAILSSDNVDPASGKSLEDLIDVESFAQKYLIDEVFGNIDGGAFSQFYYYDGADPTNRLYAGPVWDYDLSMGADFMWQIQNPRAYYANRPRVKEGIDSAWTYGLCQKDFFRDRVISLYYERMLPYLESRFNEKLAIYMAQIEAAAYLDQIRWKSKTDLQENVNELRAYMNERKKFLNSLWIDGESYHCVTLIQGGIYNNAYYMVRSGECILDLPKLEDTATIKYGGWYYCDTDEPVVLTRPVTEDIEVYAKWEDMSSPKLGQIIKLLPLGVIAIMGCILLVVDIRKIRGYDGRFNG